MASATPLAKSVPSTFLPGFHNPTLFFVEEPTALQCRDDEWFEEQDIELDPDPEVPFNMELLKRALVVPLSAEQEQAVHALERHAKKFGFTRNEHYCGVFEKEAVIRIGRVRDVANDPSDLNDRLAIICSAENAKFAPGTDYLWVCRDGMNECVGTMCSILVPFAFPDRVLVEHKYHGGATDPHAYCIAPEVNPLLAHFPPALSKLLRSAGMVQPGTSTSMQMPCTSIKRNRHQDIASLVTQHAAFTGGEVPRETRPRTD
jgi:hypothetical protein